MSDLLERLSAKPKVSLDDMVAEQRRRNTVKNADAIRARCKSLEGFIREAWHVLEPTRPYVHGWHITLICTILEAITFGLLRKLGFWNRLLINVPPGTMKSLMVSVFWPAWEWGPAGLSSLRYLTTSYSDTFATRDARRTRDLITSEWYQSLWGDKVRLVRSGETSFANSATGNREAVAFKSLTGGRGDRLLIDDPHSTETAESDADRERALRIMRESVPSRVNDAGTSAIALIMQRLHTDDASNEAMKQQYLSVILPMEFEPERRFVFEPLGLFDPRTEEGELLFPERFPRDVVERDKLAMGAYAIAGQFQQRPAPRGGAMFQRHWFRIVKAVPAGSRKTVRAWDLAASEKKQQGDPDWTVGLKVSRLFDGRFYIENEVRLRERGFKVKLAVKNTADQDGTGVRVRMPQDPGQAGKDQAETFTKLLAGYPIVIKVVTGDKEVRADGAASQAEAGNVCIVATGDPGLDAWIEGFIDELCAFPKGKHDDRVDALSDAVNELALGSGYTLDNL